MSSPGIVTYPLGGITYDAEDAAAYFSTRTSGVFSTEEDFAVTVAEDGGTAVTVGAGRAWMHPSRFTGQSVTLREARTVELPFADSNLPRIDRVVLRYDATSRSTSLQVLQGTPSSEPSAPAISRTELVYDLCLCQISRPAGQTALTTAVSAGLAGVCETGAGTVTFWAENVPEGDIQMQVSLLGPSASTADTGEDTLGDTVLEDTTL